MLRVRFGQRLFATAEKLSAFRRLVRERRIKNRAFQISPCGRRMPVIRHRHRQVLSVQTEETFRGHMVLTFIATIVAKLLSDRLKETKYPIQPTLANLATQSCSEIKGSLITSEPNKVTRLAYRAAGVEYPVCIE